MGKKIINYVGGDNLPLYSTPEQSLEESKQQEEEERRRKLKYDLYIQKQQQIRRKEILKKQMEAAAAVASSSSASSSPVSTSRINSLNSEVSNHNGMPNSPSNKPASVAPYRLSSSNINYTDSYNGSTGSVNTNNSDRPLPPPCRTRPPPDISNCSTQPHSIQKTSPDTTVAGKNNNSEAVAELATNLFHRFDVKKSGRLSVSDLQKVLQNDDSSPFGFSSVDSLVNLFGVSRFGSLNLNEFIYMYHKIKGWREIYIACDVNLSHTLTVLEFSQAIKDMGYRISVEVIENLFDQFAEYKDGTKCLKFDKFVESVVWLIRLTKVFRKYDENSNGIAIIHYKDFIDIALYLGKFLPH
ncbi:related to Peflin [Saccharomycodes ludwigii]|uniref:Related to Peflin n=1 Tax=Saccharomycodes ludwigii TaxID=36035 RepID=A0A376B7B9_9ASCO|nr:hypothetical protein SCDLUD_005233 [Saccharomycodes ludwigii]KAH3898892.1 hypothetical protein SCDLUD_005233 [Saccharomycodes ludwigii]SSD60585.1 related to Peflin [Saccharomycodes ludwigii]